MKKQLFMLTVAGQMALTAHAQSHVQLYGILDAGITYVNNQGGAPTVMEDTGIMQGNRWGLVGSEDLGGGLKAIFQLENGFDLNSGALGQGGLEFGRQALVGLSSKSAGTLTFGRQYDFMYDYLIVNTAAVQVTTAYGFHLLDADRVAGERLNNAVKYVTPNMAGLSLGALYSFSNVAGSFGGTATAPRAVSFGAKYEHGPLALGAAFTNVDGFSGSLASITLGGSATRTMGLAGRYTFNHKLTLFGNVTNTRVSNSAFVGGTAVINNYELGAAYQLTPAIRYGGGYTYTTFDGHQYQQINTAVHYYFSKQTDVYFGVNFQHTNNEKTGAGMFLVATPGTFHGFSTTDNQLAARIGIRHLF